MPEDEKTGTPRVLRITFEFEVPGEVRRNIHGSKIHKALDTATARVLGLMEGAFPWATTARVRKEWLYNWVDEWETHELPATEENTPKQK
ncbi:hypothetical protein ACFW2T_14310 [Streptomyces sp. NPDC058892]|uniref:hypothetical protein n=1 Tax=unclassified Streptomyces TaxID=2593676 RepID=UPI0036B4B298